jgi:hypothetical protein
MPLSVSQVLNKRHTITIDIDGAPLNVTYRPYTVAEREAMLVRIREDATVGEASATEFLATILLGWDLEAEPGTPYPTDAAALQRLPGEFIGAVLRGIGEAAGPGKTLGAT